MNRKFAVALACMFVLSIGLKAQDVVKPRPLTMAEYEKAKTFVIKDLDNETYVKFENTYIPFDNDKSTPSGNVVGQFDLGKQATS